MVMNTKFWILPAVCFLKVAFAASVALADAPLRPGDQIEMKLGGVPSTEISAVSGIYTIDDEGSINLPYVGRVNIAGLVPGAAESTIENVYKTREMYTNPNVVITMQAQSRFVNVGGRVKTPQRVPFTPDLTILSSINAAGGVLSLANERKVRLLRENKSMIIDVSKIRINPSLDLHLQPGDRIEVPSVLESSKDSDDKLQQGQQNADVASSHLTALETPLKQAPEKLQQAQQNSDLASGQRGDAEAQLKQAQDKPENAQQNADKASSQRRDLEAQLKQSQDKLQQAQQNADLASNQRRDLEAQLKQAQDQFQQAQQNADKASSQRRDLEAQLKQSQDKLQQAQQNADLASNQRRDLEAQLKQAQDQFQQAQQNADKASSQRGDLEAQLKQSQDKLQQAQQNADLASSQRADLEVQLTRAQDKLQRAQENADVASNQRAVLEARLKRAEENTQLADLEKSERSATSAKKREDAAKQGRSELTLPLDESGHQGRQTSIQP